MAESARRHDQPAGGTRARGPFAPATFRYLGRTQATVAGPVSGRYYRFAAPGTTIAADPRDAPWLEQLPDLLRI